jgi:hypothetical protein
MIMVWTPLEIAGKWGVFRQPWLLLKPEALVVFFGGLALGTWALLRAQRRNALAMKEASMSAAYDTSAGGTPRVSPPAVA